MKTRRIKILSVLDAFYFGGDENRVLQLAQAIDRERFDFRVATLRPPDRVFDGRYGNLRDQYREAGIDVIDLIERRGQPGEDRGPRRQARRALMLANAVSRIVKLVKRDAFDLIDGHSAPGYLCGTLAALACGVPSVMTTYNVREAWSPRPVWAALHQMTLAASGAIVTDSDAVANEIRSWMLRKSHPGIVVIPNGPPPPAAVRPEPDVREQFGLPARAATRVVGQIATLLPGKGQHILIDAAPAVLARHPDVTFLIVGFERADRRGYARELRDRAARLGIGDRVIVAPYQGHIGDVWQTIDIQAHPTMLDSLPNALLEGMSLGKPAVVSAIAGIPTLVLNGTTGLVVPPNDAPAVAAALNRLLDDAPFAEALGTAAQRRYEGGYTANMLARRMEAVFERLVASKARR